MSTTHVVRFSEVDAAGITFFSRVFEWCHHAFEDAMAARGLPIGEILGQRSWVMPLVHAEADYRSPMRLGETVHIVAKVQAVGDSSVTWGFVLSRPQGEVCATATHVHSCIDATTFRPRTLPDEVRAALRDTP